MIPELILLKCVFVILLSSKELIMTFSVVTDFFSTFLTICNGREGCGDARRVVVVGEGQSREGRASA